MSSRIRERYRGRFLAFLESDGWEYCTRVNAHGVVAVAALTPEGELLLTEQYRPPVSAPVLELPAGLAGDDPGSDGESLAAAAARELEEETGYRPLELRHAGRGPSSAGLSSELIDFFVAPRTERRGPGGGTGNERIVIHRVGLGEVRAWLEDRARGGWLIDPKVYTGLWFLDRDAGVATG